MTCRTCGNRGFCCYAWQYRNTGCERWMAEEDDEESIDTFFSRITDLAEIGAGPRYDDERSVAVVWGEAERMG